MRRLGVLVLFTCCLAAAQTAVSIAGTGVAGFSGDGGPGVEAQINNPYGLTIGPDGALYFCEIGSHRVRRLDLKSGIISTAAGSGQRGMPAMAARRRRRRSTSRTRCVSTAPETCFLPKCKTTS